MSTTTVPPAPDRQRAQPSDQAPVRDPRLTQRRVTVARQQGRKRLRAVLAVLAVAGVIGGALAVLHSPLLAARHVQVTGTVHTPVAAVVAVSGLGRRPPLIDLDTAAAAAAIDRLPWVARATVTRRWPDTVAVRIVERHPVAVLAARLGGEVLVDAAGRALAPASSVPPGLVQIVAPGGAAPSPGAEVAAAVRPMLAAAVGLAPALRSAVASIGWQPRQGVLLRLKGGAIAELGPAPQMREVSVALATLLAKVSLAHVVAIDLRVPDAPVLTS